jgi:hypothetical protein
MKLDRRLHPGRVGGWRGRAIEGDGGLQRGAGGDGEAVGHGAAPAEADDTDLAAEQLVHGEPVDRSDTIGGGGGDVERADHGARLVLVGGGTALGRQEVESDPDEAGDRQPSRDILCIGLQPAILMDHQDRGGLLRMFLGDRHIAEQLVAVGPRPMHHRGGQPLIVLGDDGGGGRIGGDRCDQNLRGGGAARQPGHVDHEGAAVLPAMGEAVVKRDRAGLDILIHQISPFRPIAPRGAGEGEA